MKYTIKGFKNLTNKDYKRIIALAIVLVVASVQPVFGESETLFVHNEALQQAASVIATATVTVKAPKPIAVVITTTAYSATVNQTDSTPEIMASGKRIYLGAIACPRRFPFGTKVKIKGKMYTCEDRMALRYDNSFGSSGDERLDILMNTTLLAFYWGVRKVKAVIFLDV